MCIINGHRRAEIRRPTQRRLTVQNIWWWWQKELVKSRPSIMFLQTYVVTSNGRFQHISCTFFRSGRFKTSQRGFLTFYFFRQNLYNGFSWYMNDNVPIENNINGFNTFFKTCLFIAKHIYVHNRGSHKNWIRNGLCCARCLMFWYISKCVMKYKTPKG